MAYRPFSAHLELYRHELSGHCVIFQEKCRRGGRNASDMQKIYTLNIKVYCKDATYVIYFESQNNIQRCMTYVERQNQCPG